MDMLIGKTFRVIQRNENGKIRSYFTMKITEIKNGSFFIKTFNIKINKSYLIKILQEDGFTFNSLIYNSLIDHIKTKNKKYDFLEFQECFFLSKKINKILSL